MFRCYADINICLRDSQTASYFLRQRYIMSQSNSVPSTEFFDYVPSNDLTTLRNVDVSNNDLARLISELRDELRNLKILTTRTITKLTEEVVSLKLECRRNKDRNLQKLPLNSIDALIEFDEEVQKDDRQLDQFKQFISKTGGDGPAQFLRAAIRKVFTDELSSGYSWKGTATKPSAEKCYLVTLIKNICHVKYKCTDKDMNGVLQKHYVHAKDRISKRQRYV